MTRQQALIEKKSIPSADGLNIQRSKDPDEHSSRDLRTGGRKPRDDNAR
jgi:hypothetical protein